MGIEDPGDARFGDGQRGVGAGMHRVRVTPLAAVGIGLLLALGSLVGLAVVVAVAYLAAWPTLAVAVVYALAGNAGMSWAIIVLARSR